MNKLLTQTSRFTRLAQTIPVRRVLPTVTHIPRQFSQQIFNAAKKENNFFLFQKPIQQKRSYANWQSTYPNMNTSGLSTQEIVTAGLGLAALIGVGYYATKYWNQPNATIGAYDSTESARSLEIHSIPDYVHDYLFNTYKYVIAGLGVTAAAAVVAYKSGLVFRIAQMNPWINLLVFGGGTIGSMVVTQSINPDNKLAKHLAFVTMNTIMGMSLCTLGLIYNPAVMVRAGLYTLAMFSGLSWVAMNAREDRFLYLGGPLMAGLCVLIVASLSSMLLPARFQRTLSILEALTMYGGLALFGAFILYDTQKLMFRAREYEAAKTLYIRQAGPNAHIPQPDYVSQSIGLYLDFINIFIRMLYILGNSNRRK
jgi:FtsH-binding integral membrane protein